MIVFIINLILGVARSKNVLGPYEKMLTPVLATGLVGIGPDGSKLIGPGHATFVRSKFSVKLYLKNLSYSFPVFLLLILFLLTQWYLSFRNSLRTFRLVEVLCLSIQISLVYIFFYYLLLFMTSELELIVFR